LTHRTHTSQTEDSQPYNRAVQSITTDKEDKDIEAKGNKKVKIIETDKSENKQVKATSGKQCGDRK
jgi:flagellar basal body rod protein FlgC